MLTLALLTFVIALALGVGCAVEPTVPARPVPARPVSEPRDAEQLPPIDRRAPAHLETATFALG